MQVEFTMAALQFCQEAHKVLKGPAKSVNAPSRNHINVPPDDCFVQLVEAGPCLSSFGAADRFVFEDSDNVNHDVQQLGVVLAPD
jgi:hypothetical protein